MVEHCLTIILMLSRVDMPANLLRTRVASIPTHPRIPLKALGTIELNVSRNSDRCF
jgi:hypothetical protein